MSKSTIHHVLWTGGLDSTCRIVELSLQETEVQPYYVLDPKRTSSKYEIKAMHDIADNLARRESTKFHLKDVILINLDEIAPDEVITSSWQVLKSKFSLGSQYDWLSRYAKQRDIKLEIGLQFSHVGRVARAFGNTSRLYGGGNCDCMMVDEEHSTTDIINVFGRFLFPNSLYHKSKLDEISMMRDWGFNDIIDMTWFCHSPVLGMPCGHCNPCKDVIKEGMSFRIQKKGYALGAIRKIVRFPLYVFHGIRHRLMK